MDFDEANELIEHTDLEKVLIGKGVQLDHINYLKYNCPIFLEDFYEECYEREVDKDCKGVLVSPKKIVSINRANCEFSFYDNAAGKCSSDLNVYRMAKAIMHIKNDTLKQIYSWYETLYYPVDLIYLEDEDIYMIGCDGNHRSLYALIVNAPVIKANVSYYKKNVEVYKAYLQYKALSDTYALIDIDSSSFYQMKAKEYFFDYNGKEYYVEGYTFPKDENTNQYSKVKVEQLENELRSDWKYLNSKILVNGIGKNYKVLDFCLNLTCKDDKQRKRIRQHIIKRRLA